MYVDSHCHLDYHERDGDLDEVVTRARDAGVRTLVTICTKMSNCETVRGIAERFLDGCHVVEVDRVAAKRAGEHREKTIGVVMLAFVAEEEHSDRAISGLGQAGRARRSRNSGEAQQRQ